MSKFYSIFLTAFWVVFSVPFLFSEDQQKTGFGTASSVSGHLTKKENKQNFSNVSKQKTKDENKTVKAEISNSPKKSAKEDRVFEKKVKQKQNGTAVLSDLKKIEEVKRGGVEQAFASWWGYDPEDSTEMLQSAIRSGVRKLVIDRQSGPWIVRPIFLESRQEIILEEGVEILAKKNEFHAPTDALFTVKDKTDVVVRGEGKGAVLRMRKADYQSGAYSKAEWRHCILLRSSKNVRIENLLLTESGGDGICIGGEKGGNRQCENIVVKNVVCDANHRQGISVGSSVNLLIEDTVLKNTSGTAPQAGIDFEPDIPLHYLVNVVMRRCVSENNNGSGYDFYLVNMNDSGIPVSFILDQCVSRNNRGASVALTTKNRKRGMLDGSFYFKNCLFDNDGGGIQITGKPVHGPAIVFENTVLNWRLNEPDTKAKAWNASPLRLRTLDQDETVFGNIDFGTFRIRYKSDHPFISFSDESVYEFGAQDLRGHFQIDQNGVESKTELNSKWCAENCPASDSPRLPLIDPALIGVSNTADDKAVINSKKPNEKNIKLVPVDSNAPGFESSQYPKAVLPVKVPRQFLCYAQKGKEAVFGIQQFRFGIQPVKEVTLRLTSPTGKRSTFKIKATLNEENEIRWIPKETGIWSIIPNKGNHILGITRSNIPITVSFLPAVEIVRGPGRYYFYVPEGSKQFGVKIVGSDYSPVKAAIYDPSGKQVWSKDSINKNESWFSGDSSMPACGVWSFTLERTKERPFTICSVFLTGIPSLIGSAPDRLLKPANAQDNSSSVSP